MRKEVSYRADPSRPDSIGVIEEVHAVAADQKHFPPRLTLPPATFFAQLVDLYLFSLLHATFYSSLMAESRARLAHLGSALRRLERYRGELLQKRNRLRQEEITEESEVLMLRSLATIHRREWCEQRETNMAIGKQEQ